MRRIVAFGIGLLIATANAVGQTYTYPAGTKLRLTAVLEEGATFDGWSGAVTGTMNPIEITLDSSATVHAAATPAPPPPPPPPPQDPTLTVTTSGPVTVMVEVVPPEPPPPPISDTWSQVPGTKLRPVLQPGLVSPAVGITWPRAIFLAENGGAFCGGAWYSLVAGGHADGAANNVYRLPLEPSVGPWERLTDTSPLAEIQNQSLTPTVHSDGQPSARHTYNNVLCLPNGKLLLYSGSRAWGGAADHALFEFDPSARTWTRLMDSPVVNSGGISTSSGWHEARSEWVLRRGSNVYAYQRGTDTWRTVTPPPGEGNQESAGMPGIVVGDAFYMLGQMESGPVNPQIWRYALPGPSSRTIIPFTGETALLSGRTREIGLAWEPALNRIIAWRGGQDLYEIDVSVTPIMITKRPMGGGVPPAAYTQGTFGRFARIGPGRYLYVHDVDGDVWIATVAVGPDPPDPPDPPSSSGDEAARIVCPGTGETTAIPNDPYRDGCWSKPFDVSRFFASPPFGCSTLKPGNVYLGPYPWTDGGTISPRRCVDVRTQADFKAIQNFGAREQMVAIIHNDLFVDASNFVNLAAKGELLVLGIPDASGRPPHFTSNYGTMFNWQATSGNFALVNLISEKGVTAGSGPEAHRQTVTVVGFTFSGVSRMLFTSYEGGADPPRPINDHVYVKNSMAYGSSSSHNIYLDRNRLHYAEGLISYGNRSDASHGMKMEAQQVFLYGSWFGNAGVLGNLPDDDSGLAGFDSVSCHEGVVRGNHFANAATTGQSNPSAYQTQERVAIVGCDMPQGYLSNTYPTRPYTGPVTYRGVDYALSPFWDPTWWATGDELRTYVLGNVVLTRNNGAVPPAHTSYPWRAFMSRGSFPTTYYPPAGDAMPTPDMPPVLWRERAIHVLANNCLEGDLLPQHLYLNYPPPFMTCANATWSASWPACQTGAVRLNDSTRFRTVGANACGVVDTLPPEVLADIARLEAIPDPPWRHW